MPLDKVHKIAARATGPATTLALVAILSNQSDALLAFYAVTGSLYLLCTAPLNQFAEQLVLRNFVEGDAISSLQPALAICVLSAISLLATLILEIPISVGLFAPIFGVAHITTKIRASEFRSKDHAATALWLDFSIRPVLTFFYIASSISIFSRTNNSVILEALVFASAASFIVSLPSLRRIDFSFRTYPWSLDQTSFFIIGGLIALGSQFEVFFSTRYAENTTSADFKIILQLSSIAGIAVNFILLDRLKKLYEHADGSQNFQDSFRTIQFAGAGVAILISMCFASAGLFYDAIWPSQIWLLASLTTLFIAISSAFGPIANRFYKQRRPQNVAASLLLLIFVKIVVLITCAAMHPISPFTLSLSYGCGLLAQNLFLLYKWRSLKASSTVGFRDPPFHQGRNSDSSNGS